MSSTDTAPLWTRGAEVVFLVLMFFVCGGGAAPEVNEAQYLCKAKQYWDPAWCANDHFLSSADAHLGFYWMFGWITRFVDLSTSAWIGRFAAWILLAVGWQKLSWRIVPRFGASVLSAGLWIALMRWCHLSGEWVIGGIEAKTFAYVFVVWALNAAAADDWKRVFQLLGIASAWHVLVGGWSVVAAALAFGMTCRSQRGSWRSLVPSLIFSGLLALPGIVPGLLLVKRCVAEIAAEGYRIYVFERLQHHLVFRSFPWHHVAGFTGMIAVWLSLPALGATTEAYRRIGRFVLGSLLIPLVGIVADLSIADPLVAGKILRYYWFRLSDVALPIGASLGLLEVLACLARRNRIRIVVVLASIASAAAIANVLFAFNQNRAVVPAADRQGNIESIAEFVDWKDVCEWASTSTTPESRFLAPPDHQTFKWYSKRSEVVNWKDIPQDVTRIVEWHARLQTIRGFLHSSAGSDPEAIRIRLKELAKRFEFQYFVSSKRQRLPPLPLRVVYQNASYVVYETPSMTKTP